MLLTISLLFFVQEFLFLHILLCNIQNTLVTNLQSYGNRLHLHFQVELIISYSVLVNLEDVLLRKQGLAYTSVSVGSKM